ncbi:uncharacterized protein LOC132707879 [Cylas formicarius]|uniref:uncharacterized protein LOC132707879 n=1 Tax=Cylas formicarius TaxID=197179 RepID=UPI002958D3CB|nr:uncharacterized protein LOC132707879 [Cylas formicarius]
MCFKSVPRSHLLLLLLAGTVSAASVSLRPAPVVFATVRAVVDNVFAVLAQLIAPLVNLLTFIRQTFVENALNLVTALAGTAQTNPAILIVQTLLVVANETLSNVTALLTTGGGAVLSGAQAGVDGIIDFVASFFLV